MKSFFMRLVNLILLVVLLLLLNTSFNKEKYALLVTCYFNHCMDIDDIRTFLSSPELEQDPEVAFILGQIYALGLGVEKDIARAKRLFSCQSKQGTCIEGNAEYFTALKLLRNDFRKQEHYYMYTEEQRVKDALYWMNVAINKNNKLAIDWLQKCKEVKEHDETSF